MNVGNQNVTIPSSSLPLVSRGFPNVLFRKELTAAACRSEMMGGNETKPHLGCSMSLVLASAEELDKGAARKGT